MSPSPGKTTKPANGGYSLLYKSYKLQETHLPRVSFPSPAYRPPEGHLTLGLDRALDNGTLYVTIKGGKRISRRGRTQWL